jgi:flavodoxin
MKPYLILYFSKTGNSKFMAHKLASELACDIEPIQPRIQNLVLLLLLSWMKLGIPVKGNSSRLLQYREIIIFGPIWAGLLVAPLRTIIKQCMHTAKPIHFALTCESKESDKDGEYGYNHVLAKVHALGGKNIKTTEAFSTSWVTDFKEGFQMNLSDKIKFTDDNYSAALQMKLHAFAERIAANATA